VSGFVSTSFAPLAMNLAMSSGSALPVTADMFKNQHNTLMNEGIPLSTQTKNKTYRLWYRYTVCLVAWWSQPPDRACESVHMNTIHYRRIL
jgi:hypothetical protein